MSRWHATRTDGGCPPTPQSSTQLPVAKTLRFDEVSTSDVVPRIMSAVMAVAPLSVRVPVAIPTNKPEREPVVKRTNAGITER